MGGGAKHKFEGPVVIYLHGIKASKDEVIRIKARLKLKSL